MILRKQDVKPERVEGSATRMEARFGEAGGLVALGANVVTLQPGEHSSDRHWHSRSDEFLFVLDGVATVVEDDDPHRLAPGDWACWPAGVANAHRAVNRTETPIRFLVAGTHPETDIVRYPDSGRTLYEDPTSWRIEADDGTVLSQGTTAEYEGG